LKQILIAERFQWAQKLFPILKQFENDGVCFYEVVAAHADIKNRNDRVYTADELRSSASSLSERPLNINHDSKRLLSFPENQVLAARYEDGIVECIIQVADPEVNRMIDSGEISKVSIEGLYLDESKNTSDTEYPSSLHFKALALLTKDDEPGDPLAEIIKDSLNVNVLLTGQIQSKLRFISEKSVSEPKLAQEAVWTTSYVNDLPDDSFAFISPGGKKDETGKTVPRSLRHFPYKDASGKIDPAHVRNALARLSQAAISPQGKAAARKELVAAANKVGIQTSMDKALAEFARAWEEFKIATELQKAVLESMEINAEDDSVVNPSSKNDQDSDDKPIQGNASHSSQQAGAGAPKLDPEKVQGNTELKTDKPKMDYPESANPLAITNDQANRSASGNQLDITVTRAPDLHTALTNATTNVLAKTIPRASIEERAPNVTRKQIRVTVSK
jgi:hypothetical protein